MLTPFISWILDIIQLIISVLLESKKSPQISRPLQNSPKQSPNSSKEIKDSIPILNKQPQESTSQIQNSPKPEQLINQTKLNFVSNDVSPLSEEDFNYAAAKLNVEVATIKSVYTVESRGSGYLSSKRPKILFEAHHFSKFTNRIYDQTHPDISSRSWNRTLYKGGEKEYDRLSQALELNQSAALKSASWGLFQILGSNFKACGFDCVEDLVRANVQSHSLQLEAFINFIKSTKLDVYLRNKDWVSFARSYNGAGYAANQYDKKLQEAYNKFTK